MHSDILMYLEMPSNSQVLLCLQGLHRLFQCICNSIHGTLWSDLCPWILFDPIRNNWWCVDSWFDFKRRHFYKVKSCYLEVYNIFGCRLCLIIFRFFVKRF